MKKYVLLANSRGLTHDPVPAQTVFSVVLVLCMALVNIGGSGCVDGGGGRGGGGGG